MNAMEVGWGRQLIGHKTMDFLTASQHTLRTCKPRIMRSRTELIRNLLKTRHDPSQILVKLAVRDALEGCESVLDVGCGASPTMRELGVARSVGAEGYRPSIERVLKEKLQDDIVECDVRQLSKHFTPSQFDACVALDVIEHVNKADGLELMKSMET